MTRRTVIGKSQVSEIIEVNGNVKINIPNNEIITPQMKARRMAYSTPKTAYSAVKMDIIAVGPTVTSLLLPNIMYTKHPINAE